MFPVAEQNNDDNSKKGDGGETFLHFSSVCNYTIKKYLHLFSAVDIWLQCPFMPTWCFNVLLEIWNRGQNCRDWDFCECIDLETVLLSSPVSLVKLVGCGTGNKINCKSEGNQACWWKGRVFRYGKGLPNSLQRWTLGMHRRAFKSNRHWLYWVRTQQMDCHLLKWKSELQMNCLNVTTLKPNKQTKEWKLPRNIPWGEVKNYLMWISRLKGYPHREFW